MQQTHELEPLESLLDRVSADGGRSTLPSNFSVDILRQKA
jgi:hypothetical protein